MFSSSGLCLVKPHRPLVVKSWYHNRAAVHTVDQQGALQTDLPERTEASLSWRRHTHTHTHTHTFIIILFVYLFYFANKFTTHFLLFCCVCIITLLKHHCRSCLVFITDWISSTVTQSNYYITVRFYVSFKTFTLSFIYLSQMFTNVVVVIQSLSPY